MPEFDGFHPSMMELDLDRLLRSELERDETLLWTGQPRAGRMMLRTIPIVLFAIPWTAFSLFWIGMALSFAADFGEGRNEPEPFRWFSLVFPLFGLPFLLIGLGMLSTPWWAWRKAKRTCYAVTDQRAIIRDPGLSRGVTVRSFRPDQLGRMVRTERPDGSGDLVFEGPLHHHNEHRRGFGRPGFFGISNVREVEQLIQQKLLDTEAAGAE